MWRDGHACLRERTLPIDIERARADTPGCRNVVHFNNAGASLPPSCVTDAAIAHLRREAEMGAYEAEAEAAEAIAGTYTSAARLLGCASEEVALVENATRAWDMGFYSLKLAAGDRILTSMAEYSSNYIGLLQRAAQTGAVIDVVGVDHSGALSVSALEKSIDERVKLIAITHVGTNGGLVNPAEAVGKIANAAGITYLLDATQSVGQMPIDVGAIGCDILCCTGRKYLRGPRGTGMLYVRRELADTLEPPFLDNLSAEWVSQDRYTISSGAKRFETWETNVAARIALGAAIDYALEMGLGAIRDRIVMLAERLRVRLSQLPNVTVRDLGGTRCGLTTFTVQGRSGWDVRNALYAQGINVWVSPMASTRLDMEARGLSEVVRASVHYYNTEEEIEVLCDALELIANTSPQ